MIVRSPIHGWEEWGKKEREREREGRGSREVYSTGAMASTVKQHILTGTNPL
jgi:hypothetical protein